MSLCPQIVDALAQARDAGAAPGARERLGPDRDRAVPDAWGVAGREVSRWRGRRCEPRWPRADTDLRRAGGCAFGRPLTLDARRATARYVTIPARSNEQDRKSTSWWQRPPGSISLALFAGLILVPAWSSYSRVWERLAATVLSLYVLAVLVGVGVVGALAAVYFWG